MKLATLIIVALSAACAAAETGLASWYGEEHRGDLMANGRPFNPDKPTAASWHYPLGTKLVVIHGKKRVKVTVTDRGPNERLWKRVVDLSESSFRQLAPTRLGLVKVTVVAVR